MHMINVQFTNIATTVDLENFGVKKLRKAQTSTKLKHTRFFYYDNFAFEYMYMHLPFIAHTRARQMYVTITYTRLKVRFALLVAGLY